MTNLEQIAYGVLITVVILVAGAGLIWAVVRLLVFWTTRPERIQALHNERRSLLEWAIKTGKPQEEINLLRKAWKM